MKTGCKVKIIPSATHREGIKKHYGKVLEIERVATGDVTGDGMLPKCEHKHIIGGDGCFECTDCGERNY